MFPPVKFKRRHLPLLLAVLVMTLLRTRSGHSGHPARPLAIVATLLGALYALTAFLPESAYASIGLAALRPTPPLTLAVGIVIALLGLAAFPAQAKKYSRVAMQTGIVLLGFWISLDQVAAAGLTGLALSTGAVVLAVLASFVLARALRTPAETSTLLAAGTAICGGSAIAATGTVINASAAAMAVSTAIVFILNAVGVFAYPSIGHALEMSQHQFGAWCAIGVHDVAGVVAAAKAYGPEALAHATVIKLTRVLWIVPTALVLAHTYKGALARAAAPSTSAAAKPASKPRRLPPLPMFIVFFVLACLLRAGLDRVLDPAAVASAADTGRFIATGLMTLALFLIGLGLSRDALRHVGARPALHGLLLWIIVSVSALLAVRAFL